MKLPRMQAYCINYFPFCLLIAAASVAIVTHVCCKEAKQARWKKMCCRCLAQWAGNTVLLVFHLLSRTTNLCYVWIMQLVLIHQLQPDTRLCGLHILFYSNFMTTCEVKILIPILQMRNGGSGISSGTTQLITDRARVVTSIFLSFLLNPRSRTNITDL